MAWRVLLCGIALLGANAVVHRAEAATSLGAVQCPMHFAGSNASADVEGALNAGLGEAIQDCTTTSGDHTYAVVSKVRPSRLGACKFTVKSIYKHAKPGGQSYWDLNKVPGSYGQVFWIYLAPPQANCPRQDDARYTAVIDLTEGTYIDVMSAWNAIAKSPRVFSEALVSLDDSRGSRGNAEILRKWFKESAAGEKQPEMGTMILHRDLNDRDALQTIELDVYQDDLELDVYLDFSQSRLHILHIYQPEY